MSIYLSQSGNWRYWTVKIKSKTFFKRFNGCEYFNDAL